jgi:uncharacterized protein YaaR (DUF327 family)
MAQVTNENMYEVLKQIQDGMTSFGRKLDEFKTELHAVRAHSVAIQEDIHNIYSILVRHEGRLERIERRLDIVEVPA